MTGPGPELDTARALVVERGLTADAIAALTPLVRELPPEALTPVKQLLKRFFSDQPWSAGDDDALADAVGGGSGGGEHELEPGLSLTWSWVADRFRLRVTSGSDLEQTFEGAVVPEATPSPRTIRFATPPIHEGPSRTYDSAESAASDPGVARLFKQFDEVTNVLVGPSFVAVTIARPDRWEALLAPMLRTVTEGFTGDGPRTEAAESAAPMTISFSAGSDDEGAHAPRRLERAWTELGALRADRPEHLEQVVAATRDKEPARRQVAAALLADAPPDAARHAWARMLDDSSRVVRRSVVDAVAGAEREELRPLLERALDDADAWVRWKALHGIAAVGAGASRAVVEALTADSDFRVRLEAARAIAAAGS